MHANMEIVRRSMNLRTKKEKEAQGIAFVTTSSLSKSYNEELLCLWKD